MAAGTKSPSSNGNGRARNGAAALEEVKKQVASTPVDNFREAAPLLRAPFTPQAVKFKVQATWPKGEPTGAMVVTYIDARLVIERLNMVVAENWTPKYEPAGGNLMWCYLSLFGLPSRPDVGEGVGKGLVSDALKRAAVHWGVGVSLYATPKMFFELGDHGFLKQVRSENGQTLKLTPKGEARCLDIYKDWLEKTGIPKYGEPLDHGDAEEAIGDVEAEGAEVVRADESATAPTAGGSDDQGGGEPAAKPSPADAEAQIAELLAKKSTLKEKRVKANEGMERLGAGPEQRLRELQAATTKRDLDALIARVNRAMDGGGANG